MKNKICCFGEVLMRLSPSASGIEWMDNMMPFHIGGAELNVATALSKWQLQVKYITALPQNYLSDQLIKYFNQRNIDSSSIIYTGNRLGIYYLPVGYDLKNALAFYDREHTSFSALTTEKIDWDKVFEDCNWFHFTAISPALSQQVADVCLEALQAAAKKSITISIDLNYRSKLWNYGKPATSIMPELVKYCHVVMGNIWSVENLLGIKAPVSDSAGKTNEELNNAAAETDKELRKQYPKINTTAYTYRLAKKYRTLLFNSTNPFQSAEYNIENVIDRVGSGDCFMAGIIYGLYKKLPEQEIIDFATAAAVGKLYIAGDATNQTVNEIMQKMKPA
jgi:2-dehydro-3-deoxygluconokinase